MTKFNSGVEHDDDQCRNERGAALFISLILILILTFMGFGFLTRTMLVTQIAGAERWTTKAFFAADAGINFGMARLRVRETGTFTYQLEDLRGYKGTGSKGQITVTVSDFGQTGVPIADFGDQTGGGQGSGTEALYSMSFSGEATSVQPLTRSEAVVSSTLSVSDSPLFIDQ